MENQENKFDTINLVTYINELIVQTEVTQYFKNTKQSPIELQMTIPKLSNHNLTKFEMTMKDKKVVSKLIENSKAKEKYTDAIASGNYGFLSYSSPEETTIFLGNIPPNEEITLKTFFFGHIISKDYSYQASFPVIFPGFIFGENEDEMEKYVCKKQIVEGKIYVNTFSELTRLVIKGSKNFGKINKKYGNNNKSAEIYIYKDNFSERDIPGIILFRTEEINKNKIYFQYDDRKEKYYYILQKTLEIPKFNLTSKEKIDENEDINYASLLEKNDIKEKNYSKKCYIFLLDQSGSMSGDNIELCIKALLLFLQSLNKDCYFQLIGFGSNFEYYNKEPLEYNKDNISNLMEIIRNLRANKGGTELYSPLSDIYNNSIYEKFDMIKHIFLLTDGAISDKEETLNLIGSHSDKFYFHSIGIGYCDKDLIERSALIGNGYSYFIDDLNNLNKVIISALEKSQVEISLECKCKQENNIEDKNQKYIHLNDFFRHGVILDKAFDDINFKIIYNKKEIKISSKKLELITLPKGEELGKLIVDNYLLENKSLDFRTKIKLSKNYNILCSETAFYAEIQNESPTKGNITTISNKNKFVNNNNNIIEPETDKEISLVQEPQSDMRNIGYESTNNYFAINENDIRENKNKKNKKSFLSCIYSIFYCKKEKNKIINRKVFNSESIKNIESNELNEDRKVESNQEFFTLKRNIKNNHRENYSYKKIQNKKRSIKNKKPKYADCDFKQCYNYDKDSCCDYKKCEKNIISCLKSSCLISDENEDCSKEKDSPDKGMKKKKKNKKYDENIDKLEIVEVKDEKKLLNFDEIILDQDIIEGSWKKNNKTELLLKEENDLFEKIKKFSENKGINDENGIITLFILFYIFHKKAEKIEELKFIIEKAKNFIKKIFNLEYDEIVKELNLN